MVMLDPWYNKGVGVEHGMITEDWLVQLLRISGGLADHVYVWGFPEIVWRLLTRVPKGLVFVAWLTWYYKNCPSVIRGWRYTARSTLASTFQGPARISCTQNTS